MMRLGILLAAAALLGACGRTSSPQEQSPAAVSVPTQTPHAALSALDKRKPLPLLPMMANHQKANMREHLVAVQEITSALSKDDYAAAEQAAHRLGFSEQVGQMCTHMGAGAPGFAEQALAFHHTADRIAASPRHKDRAQALADLGATLQACTGCHAAWKQEIVDEATWQRLAAAPVPASH